MEKKPLEKSAGTLCPPPTPLGLKSARNENQNFCRRFGLLTFFKDILNYTDEQTKIEIRRKLLGVISSHSEIIQTKAKIRNNI